MIEQKGLAVFNKAVAETITRAVCTISGKDYTLPIKSVTVEGAKFKVNIYLDDTLSGTVTNTKLDCTTKTETYLSSARTSYQNQKKKIFW